METPEPITGKAVDFAYDSLDARPVSASAMRGKVTVLAFVATYDLGSQAQVNYLVAMAKHDAAKVNYVMVALDQRTERELVEVYKTDLNVTFPVALADAETIGGGGPFGDVHRIPAVVVLDREGQIESDLPPVGDAIGEFRRAVEAAVRGKAAGKRRILLPERDVIEVLLNRELAGCGDAGIVNLDFVGGLGRWCRQQRQDCAGQQAEE